MTKLGVRERVDTYSNLHVLENVKIQLKIKSIDIKQNVILGIRTDVPLALLKLRALNLLLKSHIPNKSTYLPFK